MSVTQLDNDGLEEVEKTADAKQRENKEGSFQMDKSAELQLARPALFRAAFPGLTPTRYRILAYVIALLYVGSPQDVKDFGYLIGYRRNS